MKHLSKLLALILTLSILLCGCNTSDIIESTNEITSTLTTQSSEESVTEAGSTSDTEIESDSSSSEETTVTEDTANSDTNDSTEQTTIPEETTLEETTHNIGEIPEINEADDPYENIDKDAFYENYTPAQSYEDSYFRTQNNLMSGSIAMQHR